MMPLDAARGRVVGRYRVMFKTTLFALSGSMALMGTGLLVAAASAGTFALLAFGMILTGLSGLNAYRLINSTAKILDANSDERRFAESAARRAGGRV